MNFFFFSFLFCSFLFASLAFGQKTAPEENWLPPETLYSPQKTIVSDVPINFVEAGKGRPMLLLHGLGGSWKDWAVNLPYFSTSYRAIAIDFPGFGDSAKPEADYSIGWLTAIVESFLQGQKLEQAVVMGHSMGGLVALNLAARSGSRVKTLVVVDVVGIGDKSEFLSYALTKKIMGPDSGFESFEGLLREEFKAMVENFIKRQKPKTSKEFFQSVPKNPFTGRPFLPMTPAVQMSASIIDFDIRPQLAFIRQPTLILWGSKDPVAPLQDAAILKSKIPQAALTILKNCGHSPMQERPERFNREVEKFLQAAESDSSK